MLRRRYASGSSNYPKVLIHEKAPSTSEIVCGSWRLSGTRKRDQSLFSLLLEIESRPRREGRNDQIEQRKRSKEKDRRRSEATISPAIASSRYPSSPSDPHHKSRCSWGSVLLVQITLVRPGVGKCTGGEAQSTPSLHCWFVCCNQLNSRFLPNLRPGLQSCNTTNLTA